MVYSMILKYFGRVQRLCAPHERLDSDSQAPGWQLSLLTLYALQLGMSLSSAVAFLCPSTDVRSLQKRDNSRRASAGSLETGSWHEQIEKGSKDTAREGLIEFPISANECRSHQLLHSRRQEWALRNAFDSCDCMRILGSIVCLAHMV